MELRSSLSNHKRTDAQSYRFTKKIFSSLFCMWLIALFISYARHADLGIVMTIGIIIVLVLSMSVMQEKYVYALLAIIQEKKPHNLMEDQADWQMIEYVPSASIRSSFYSWTDYVIEQARFMIRKTEQSMRYVLSYVCAQISMIIGALLLGLPVLFTVSQLLILTGITIIFTQFLVSTAFSYPASSSSKRLLTVQDASSISMFALFWDAFPLLISVGLIFYANYQDNLPYARTMALVTCIVWQVYCAWDCKNTIRAFHNKQRILPFFFGVGIMSLILMICIEVLCIPFVRTILKTVVLSFSDWKIIFFVIAPMIFIEQGVRLIKRYRCQD